jgi:hypothetical protein
MFGISQPPIEININVGPQKPPYLPCHSALEDMFCPPEILEIEEDDYVPAKGAEMFGFAAPSLFKVLMQELSELDDEQQDDEQNEQQCSKSSHSIVTRPNIESDRFTKHAEPNNEKDEDDVERGFKYWFK